MSLSNDAILNWTRVLVLLVGMGWAAWMDHKERRVKNEHWLVWIKPAIFIWALDLMIQGADWTILLTASAVVAYASMAVIGRPSLKDLLRGSKLDLIVTTWYMVSLTGVICGAILYQQSLPLEVLVGNDTSLGALWWKTLAVGGSILIIDLAWRVRMIHGGADAKCLMWVAILIPSWSALPLTYSTATIDSIVSLPPAISLLMWGGFIFLLIPFIMLGKNISNGNVKKLSDLRLAWHASMMPLKEVVDSHVWLLSSVIEMPDGTTTVHHKTRAPSRTPTDEELLTHVSTLQEIGVEFVWVSYKLPLLVFLFPAIIPFVLIGDPMSLLLPMLGL
ncbi:hypothetical protein OAM96_03520 [Candidatus Poseidoniaceae archaeon]|nr:hypothetical protein [Candidatus Poseidoniaceae archaeon]|tara:strand:- start:3168 stop:4166 length:999 start_codon:yes stop_codon:yes gene_type:complete